MDIDETKVVDRLMELGVTEELELELTGTDTLEDTLEELEVDALELLDDGNGPLAW
jgi:Fe2+ transport system protein FeoA